MKHILTLLVVCSLLPSLLFAQSSPMILQMDVEEISGTDEIIAHLRVVQYDSVFGFHMGLIWDIDKATFIQIEDDGPKMGSDKQTFSTIYANQGFVQNLWVSFPLECVSLDSGEVLYSLRFKRLEQDIEFTLLADTSIYLINNIIKPHFETVDCNSMLKDVIYISNQNNTIQVQNGTIVSNEEPTHWQSVKLYPNPVRDILVIEGLEDITGKWILSDLYGRTILSGPVHHSSLQIQVNHLSDSFYFIKIQSVNGQFISKPIHIQRN